MKGANQSVVRTVSAILVCITVAGVVYLATNENFRPSFTPIFLTSFSTVQTLIRSGTDNSTANPDNPLGPSDATDELKESLSKAANKEKTVIITTLNAAWAHNNSIIDLFLRSFHIGERTEALLNNLLIVAVDEKALNRCREIHSHCYLMKTEGVDFSGEKFFMSEDYLKMMWRRLLFFGEVLERGYNFLFSDADIMWFRNPFPKLSSKAEFQIASDRYNGKPNDLLNSPNGGFMYVHSNEKTFSFFKFWYGSKKDYIGLNEQDVLNVLKWKEFRSRGIEVEFLDTKYFGGYCERTNDLNSICTMHANCCRGLKAKLIDLRNTISDWEKYKQEEQLGKAMNVSWTFPEACNHSWSR